MAHRRRPGRPQAWLTTAATRTLIDHWRSDNARRRRETSVALEASGDADTDWSQILALYDVLTQIAPSPAVTLSRTVAVAMVHGPTAGLAALGTLDDDDRLAHSHRLEAVRAHLLEQAGNHTAAYESYLRAARMTTSLPEQRYLTHRAANLRI